MGGFAQPITYGLMAGGTVGDAIGRYRQGQAEAQAARFNANQIRRETDRQLEAASTAQRRAEATNITRVAKSGVRLEGSPLLVLESNRRQAEIEQDFIRSSGSAQADLERIRGRNAKAAARVGVASSVIGGAGRIGSHAVRYA